MYFNNNDYSIPVVLGSNRSGIAAAFRLLKLRGTRPHIFTDRVDIFRSVFFKCHCICPQNDELVSGSLVAFASELEEYYTPILLLTDEWSRSVADHNSEVLGARYILVDANDYFKGERNDDNE